MELISDRIKRLAREKEAKEKDESDSKTYQEEHNEE